jgi:hypothetical protein
MFVPFSCEENGMRGWLKGTPSGEMVQSLQSAEWR